MIGVLAVALVGCGGSSSSKSAKDPKVDRKAASFGSNRRFCFNTTEPEMRIFFEWNAAPNGAGPYTVTRTGNAVCALQLADNNAKGTFKAYVRTGDEYFVALIQAGKSGVSVVPKGRTFNDPDYAYKEGHDFIEGDQYTFSQYMEDGYKVSMKRISDSSVEEYLVSIGR